MNLLNSYLVYWIDRGALLSDGSWDTTFMCIDGLSNERAAIQFARSITSRHAFVCKIISPEGSEISGANLNALIGKEGTCGRTGEKF